MFWLTLSIFVLKLHGRFLHFRSSILILSCLACLNVESTLDHAVQVHLFPHRFRLIGFLTWKVFTWSWENAACGWFHLIKYDLKLRSLITCSEVIELRMEVQSIIPLANPTNSWFILIWSDAATILSHPFLLKIWTLKHIFPSYVKSKNSESPKELSLRNFSHPSWRKTPMPVSLSLTVHERAEPWTVRLALSDDSFDICFKNSCGICFITSTSIKIKKKRIKLVMDSQAETNYINQMKRR